MAKQSEWEKANAKVKYTIRDENGDTVYAEGVNPATGKKETFRGTVWGNSGWLTTGTNARNGEEIDVYVDPDKTLWWHNYRMVKKGK